MSELIAAITAGAVSWHAARYTLRRRLARAVQDVHGDELAARTLARMIRHNAESAHDPR